MFWIFLTGWSTLQATMAPGDPPLRRWRRRLVSVAAAPLIAYGILILFGWLMEGRLLFPEPDPSRPIAEGEGSHRLLETGEDSVIAFEHLEAAPDVATLIYLPGPGTGLAGSRWFIRALHSRGWNVASLDYPGTGMSSGRRSEAATRRALGHLYDHLTGDLGVDPDQIVVFGRSLGAAAALQLAVEKPLAGVVAESAFLSAFEVLGPMRWLPWTRFDNRIPAAAIRVPVLFIHGTADRTVPFAQGRELKAMTGEYGAHLWIEGAGHQDLLEFAGEAYWTVLREFIASLDPREDTAASP